MRKDPASATTEAGSFARMHHMDVSERLKRLVEAALSRMPSVNEPVGGVQIEPTSSLMHGDFTTNVALKIFGPVSHGNLRSSYEQGGNFTVGQSLAVAEEYRDPKNLAQNIIKEIGDLEGIAKAQVAGPGFINFRLAPKALSELLDSVRGDTRGNSFAGQKVLIEYTDPNPFKEFHIGHLMSNAIGESFSRLLEHEGASVIRANYQGDIGLHVAKAMYVLLEKKAEHPSAADIGRAYVEGSRLYEEDSDAKLKIDALNIELYTGEDAQIKALYRRGRQTCLDAFEKLYALLGTTFQYYFFESETAPRGIALVKAHPEVFEESQGATIFPGERYGLHTRVFLTRAGLPTYEAKDLGLANLKRDTVSVDRSITVTASEQTDYFAVIKKVVELCIPELAGKVEHRAHGMMRFAEGKMSSRKGNIITGESLIADMQEVALERAKESRADDVSVLASQVAIAAIKYQILKQSPGKDIVFDKERALSLEGDSGPYIQYAHARACAILEKAHEAGVEPRLSEDVVGHDVARLIIRFPDIAKRAAQELQPQLVANYAVQFAAAFNSWYANEHILDGTPSAPGKVALVDAARVTLKQALGLLGIPAPERM